MQQVMLGGAAVQCAAGPSGEAVQTIRFEGEMGEHRWRLADLDPAFPTDWSAFSYLVLELRPATPQRFYLEVQAADGPRAIRVQPFGQVAWLRAAVPLRYFRGRDAQGFDLASASNRPRAAFWFSVSGPFGSLEGIEALAVRMERPVGRPVLEIRLLGLAKEDPGSAILDALPVVDAFGQWLPGDWPGKVRSLEQLRAAWDEEAARLRPGGFGYGRYGGYRDHRAEATGFFRVERRDGRWWFVDPDGCLFLSTGANVMRPHMPTPIGGREGYYAALPPAELAPPVPLGGLGGPQASFFTWNLQRRFGADWRQQWAAHTVRRLDAWGFNTMYPGTPELIEAQPRKAYVVTVRGWQTGAAYLGLPDVYAEDFALQVDAAAARECAPRKDDPYLLGYFIGNEPPWPGREAEVVDLILAGPETATRREARAFLTAGDTPDRRVEFVLRAFERCLDLVNAAVRRHDPNHLNLGIRFGRTPSDAVLRLARGFDVYSHNRYRYAPDAAEEEHISRVVERPILIGEFHIGAPGRGLGAGLVQARDDRERGVAYRYYAEQALALPMLVGAHWFQWMDQPVTGRMDGENYNIGVVDGLDRPYWDFLDGVKLAHSRLYAVHAGQEPPSDQRPAAQ